MSDKLAISSALSVLAMATYVLFSPNAAQAPLHGDSLSLPQVEVSTSILPSLSDIIPLLR